MKSFLMVILFLTAGFAYSQDQTSKVAAPRKASEQKAGTDDRGTENKPFFVKAFEVEQTAERLEQERDENEQKRDREERLIFWTWILAIVTAFLAAFAGGQIWMFWTQLKLMRKAVKDGTKSNNLSRQAIIADQRPWITVAIEPAGPITWKDGRLQVSYKITLKNIGKSPALKVGHGEAIILERDANLVAQQKDLSKMIHSFFGVSNIMPGDDRQMIFHQQVDPDHVERAAVSWTDAGCPGLIMPVLVGTADYTTQFDSDIRHTGFIYEIGFWDPKKGITVTAINSVSDGDIPIERVRIRRHPLVDGYVD